MACRCSIKDILIDKQAEAIRNLFQKVKKKIPDGELLARIDIGQPPELSDCPSMYNWGFEYYCDNQDFIKQQIKQHKDRFPKLFATYFKR